MRWGIMKELSFGRSPRLPNHSGWQGAVRGRLPVSRSTAGPHTRRFSDRPQSGGTDPLDRTWATARRRRAGSATRHAGCGRARGSRKLRGISRRRSRSWRRSVSPFGRSLRPPTRSNTPPTAPRARPNPPTAPNLPHLPRPGSNDRRHCGRATSSRNGPASGGGPGPGTVIEAWGRRSIMTHPGRRREPAHRERVL